MTALAELLIGDSAVVLYFSESMTRNRNSTILPIFRICICFTAKGIFEFCGNGSQDQTR